MSAVLIQDGPHETELPAVNDNLEPAMTAASFAGGAASVIVNRTPSPATRKIAEGICGALAGVFLGPGVADLAGAETENKKIAIAFIVATFAVILMTGLMEYIGGATFKQWLAGWIGGKLPPGPIAPQPPPGGTTVVATEKRVESVENTQVTTTNPPTPPAAG